MIAKKEIEQLQIIKERMMSAGIDEEEVKILVQPLEQELQKRVCGLVWEHKDTSIPNMDNTLPSFVPVTEKNIVSD